MSMMLTRILQASAAAGATKEEAERLQAIDFGSIRIEAGAIRHAAPYMAEKSFRRAVIAADTHTYAAAGKSLAGSLEKAGIAAFPTLIRVNSLGDVAADEASLIQLILDIQKHAADVVVAVGSGTLHDVARYSAYTTGIPFISVPTAPSVDGFNSKGAPILLRGEKTTIAAIGPEAIFADLDILTQAPPAMAAAGFGDMLGKYTSLFDWRFGSLAAGEPYSPFVAAITRQALEACAMQAERIGRRDEEAIAALTGALLESGIAMLILGQSHPASGAEHHLSHYWEMAYIREGRRQLLHGAKVGVACAEIAALYRQAAGGDRADGPLFAAAEAEAAAGSPDDRRDRLAAIEANRDAIREAVRALPDERTIRELLRSAGGPDTVEALGVDRELLRRSLREAHRVRLNRYTLLRAINEFGG